MAASQIQCEQFFRSLSKHLTTIWEKVGTQCGLVSDEIETIKLNDTDAEGRPFQFLVGLRSKYPNRGTWSRKLMDALRKESRNDLVEQVDEFLLKEPTSDLKLISEISEEGVSGSWCPKAWLDHMTTNNVKKGRGNYYFHCFLQDSSGVSIYTSIFKRERKSCVLIFSMIKASTQSKPISLRCPRVEKQTKDHLDQPGKSNYRFIINDQSEVRKA